MAAATRTHLQTPRNSLGFTYIGVLIALAMLGSALALTGEAWHTAAQREKEQELLFIGDQFREAIRAYYEQSPGRVKTYPKSLEALLEDQRWPVAKRRLRKIYRDPMTGEADWITVTAVDGGIMGVHSSSEQSPLKKANFAAAYARFQDAGSYQDWRFVYDPKAKRSLVLPPPISGTALAAPIAAAEPALSPPGAAAPQPTPAQGAVQPVDNPREVELPDVAMEQQSAEAK